MPTSDAATRMQYKQDNPEAWANIVAAARGA